MEIINESELHSFALKHPKARSPLNNWLVVTCAATWKTFIELKNTFGSADYVQNLVIFDIGGNNYRLIASIDFAKQRIYILDVLTHDQYNRWKP